MRAATKAAAAVAAALVLASSPALAEPADVEVAYRMSWNGIDIATVIDRVSFADGRYRIESVATSEGLAKSLGLPAVNRTSEGSYSEEGGLVPERYEQDRDGKRRIALIDRASGTVTLDNEGEVSEVALTGDMVHDNLTLSYDFYVRARLVAEGSFLLTDGRRIRDIQIRQADQPETVSTGLGELEARRVFRVTDSDRNYKFWFATAHDLLPARIQLERAGSAVVFTLLEIGPPPSQ